MRSGFLPRLLTGAALIDLWWLYGPADPGWRYGGTTLLVLVGASLVAGPFVRK